MPPKGKTPTKAECVQCMNCHIVIGTKSKKIHTDSCTKEKPLKTSGISCDSGEWKLDEIDYGFVCDAIGYVCVRLNNEQDLNVPSGMVNHVALLNPALMKLCHMTIGCPIVVKHNLVLFAWPDKTLTFGNIGLPKSSRIKDGGKVMSSILAEPYERVQECVIHLQNFQNFMNSSEFSLFVNRNFSGLFIHPGQRTTLKYLGHPCEIQIAKIISEKGEIIETVEIFEDSLEMAEKSLANLSLVSGDSLNSSFQLSPPSPLSPPSKLNDSLVGANFSNFSTPQKSTLAPSTKLPSVRFFLVSDSTNVTLSENLRGNAGKYRRKKVCLDEVGGLDNEKKFLEEMVLSPLMYPQKYELSGLTPPRGILLYGASGVGKTMLAQAVCDHLTSICHVTSINGAEIWSKFYGETEAQLRNIFKEASERAPSLIFIDELDCLCPKRDSVNSEAEKRVVATLLTLMDGLQSDVSGYHVLVLATTSKPDNLDTAVRRPGRFDRELEIPIPNAPQRLAIMTTLLLDVTHNLSHTDVQTITDSCHGYVGADMTSLFKEAGFHAIKRCMPNESGNGDSGTSDDRRRLVLTMSEFLVALSLVKPSAMREVAIDVPKVLWSDIGGQTELKMKLKQAVVWPLKHPEAFTRLGIKPPKGLLMYGPPGCSKTMIAKAVATESGLNFIAIKGPELFNKWVGESERAVREVFRKARKAAPAVVFFDELDALAGKRGSSSGGHSVGERVLAQLLTEMDGIEALCDVTVIAATNRPDMIDQALLRPGRIDRIVHVPLPDLDTRADIFRIKLKTMSVSDDVEVDLLVQRTEQYSGAEIVAVCHEAALHALERDINAEGVVMQDFLHALTAITPRTTQKMIDFYSDYQKQFPAKS